MEKYAFYKNNPVDTIYWVDDPETKGVHLFSFDKKKVYNLFEDYPHKLTAEIHGAIRAMISSTSGFVLPGSSAFLESQ